MKQSQNVTHDTQQQNTLQRNTNKQHSESTNITRPENANNTFRTKRQEQGMRGFSSKDLLKVAQ